jgi:hypothetical protein
VATVPANREARACVRMSSSNLVRERMACFAAAYLAALRQLEGARIRENALTALFETRLSTS